MFKRVEKCNPCSDLVKNFKVDYQKSADRAVAVCRGSWEMECVEVLWFVHTPEVFKLWGIECTGTW